MVYCKKCARLLDEDVRFCPYCDSEDEHFMQGMSEAADGTEATDGTESTDEMNALLRQLDEQIARNENTLDMSPSGISQPGISQPGISQPGISQPDISQPGISQPDISQPGISQPDNNQPSMAVDATHAAGGTVCTPAPMSNTAKPPRSTAEPAPFTAEPAPNTAEPVPYTAEPDFPAAEPAAYTAEPAPSTGQYVGMVLLSVFLTLPGLIVGIVYMTNKSPAYRKMGLTMLLVSIGATLLWCVACCALFYVIGSTMTAMTTF